MEKVKLSKLYHSRFIVLTNKNLFAFTSDDKDADCTMNLELKNCLKVDLAKAVLKKDFTFVII